MLIRTAYALLPIGYMGMLYYLSSIPGTELGRIGLRLPDYILHAGAYAGLALSSYAALRRAWRLPSRAAGVFAWIVAVAYGVLDEYHQSFTPGRDPSLADLVADAVGAAVALCIVSLLIATRQGRSAQSRAGSRRKP